MMTRNFRAAMLLVLPLAILPVACGGDDTADRTALRDDELGRDLDLALQGDSAPATFADSAVGVAPDPEPGPAPVVQKPRAPQNKPTPAPSPRPQTPRQPDRTPAPAPTPRVVTSMVPTGTSLSLTLNETLTTERNKVGDGFTATLASAILDDDGSVLVPAGATVRGRLTQVDKSGRVGETGIIKVAFEAISFGGKSYPIDATVVKANPERKNRTSTQETVGKAAAGAAAGAILGRVLGKDTKSTVKGAVIGAAAGTAIAMGTADVDVVLPAGSEMIIRLDTPIEIRRTN